MTTTDPDKKAYEDAVISYCFSSADEATAASLEGDPERLANEITRLTMEFIAQRELWDEKLRVGAISAEEYHDWKLRSSSIRFRLQGKAPHVKSLVKAHRDRAYFASRGDKTFRLVGLIRAHKLAIEAALVEPESWDTELWAQAEAIDKEKS